MGKITPAPKREFADDLKGDRPSGPRSNNPSGRERRAAEAAARAKAARRRTLLAVGASALVILALIAVAAFVVVGRVRSTQSAEVVAQNVGTSVPDEGRTHVDVGSKIEYKSYPPASGPHYPVAPDAGVYPTPMYPNGLPEGEFVHSLEHGCIVLLYKPGTDADTMRQVQQLYTSLPVAKYGRVKVVVTPYDHMDTPITALAWDWKLPLQSFDRDAILKFYMAHVDHGPEDLP